MTTGARTTGSVPVCATSRPTVLACRCGAGCSSLGSCGGAGEAEKVGAAFSEGRRCGFGRAGCGVPRGGRKTATGGGPGGPYRSGRPGDRCHEHGPVGRPARGVAGSRGRELRGYRWAEGRRGWGRVPRMWGGSGRVEHRRTEHRRPRAGYAGRALRAGPNRDEVQGVRQLPYEVFGNWVWAQCRESSQGFCKPRERSISWRYQLDERAAGGWLTCRVQVTRACPSAPCQSMRRSRPADAGGVHRVDDEVHHRVHVPIPPLVRSR